MGCIKLKISLSIFSHFVFFFYSISFVHANLFRFQASEPLQGFFSPFFNEQGVKTWQCHGAQVKYISDAKIKMQKMCIVFFYPGQSQEVDMIVRSDKAIISLQDQSAFGKTLLTVTHSDYTILGENWNWHGKREGQSFSRIYVGKNVSVMFYDS